MENKELVQTDFALPLCRFICRENGEFVEKTTRDLFHKKRVVIFGLPGALCRHVLQVKFQIMRQHMMI